MNRKAYPSDVSDEEWAFVAPYLTLMSEDAPQREHSLREVFNALRWMVRTGAPWRYLPQEMPPWEAVYQQSQRWIRAGVFEAMVADLREILRLTTGKKAKPTAVIFDSRTLQSMPATGCQVMFARSFAKPDTAFGCRFHWCKSPTDCRSKVAGNRSPCCRRR